MRTAKDLCQKMRDILGLEYPPVAVKFLGEGEEAGEGYDTGHYRYCQTLMKARHGGKVRLSAENITCPAAASAFGLKPLPPKLENGEMMFNMGLFGTKEAAAATLARMPRLEQGRFSALLVAPLDAADYDPDVIVLEGLPEQLMWVALASIFDEGGRHNFSSGIFQATCVDSTVVPYLTQKVNATLGCYGCRDATDIKDEECLLGIPAGQLVQVVTSLEKLSVKAIPRARAKGAFKNLTGCAQP